MAKTKDIKVSICTTADYLNGKESICRVLLRAFEDYNPILFEEVCLEKTKQKAIQLGRDLWEKAHLIANTSDAQKTYDAIITVNSNIRKNSAALTVCTNFFSKIPHRWRLFKYGFMVVPAEKILAMHISKNGYKSTEYDKFIGLLNETIVSYDEIAPLFDADRVRRMLPLDWPEPKEKNFSVEEVPHLERLVELAIFKEYTHEELLKSWNEMLKMKQQQLSCDNWEGYVDLSEALHIMFSSCSYDYVKKHFAAFLVMIERA